jgi:hypothetical protein
LVGIDHNYGKLTETFPPGKITLTPENSHLLTQSRHFVSNYHKVGESVGVPDLKLQSRSYRHARAVLEERGVLVLNAGVDSHLDVFEKVSYEELFST